MGSYMHIYATTTLFLVEQDILLALFLAYIFEHEQHDDFALVDVVYSSVIIKVQEAAPLLKPSSWPFAKPAHSESFKTYSESWSFLLPLR